MIDIDIYTGGMLLMGLLQAGTGVYGNYSQKKQKEQGIIEQRQRAIEEDFINALGLQEEYSEIYSKVSNAFMDFGDAYISQERENMLKENVLQNIKGEHQFALSMHKQPLSPYDKAIQKMSWNPSTNPDFFGNVFAPYILPPVLEGSKMMI